MEKQIIENSVTIDAILVTETAQSWKLDCEGDVEWFPKDHVNFDAEKGQLEAPYWLMKRKFPEEYK